MPLACGAIQVRLAFAIRYVPMNSVLVVGRWADCVTQVRWSIVKGVNLPVA